MRLPQLAIDNRSFTWMVFIFLTVFGVRSLITMPRTENPEVTVPGSSIIVLMPGAGPLDMESLVALPLEEAMNELDDIERIITDVRDGIAVISVEFDFETDADEKYEEVVRQVNSIRGTLPDEILQLETWQWSISDMSMMLMALISEDAPFKEMEQVSDELAKRFEKIRSIRKVTAYALPGQEVHIHLDFEKMALVNTSLDQITRAIQSNNMNIPGGDISLGNNNLNVKSSGSFKDLEEIRNMVVNSHMGRLIHLKDVATLGYGYEDQNYRARFGAKSFRRDSVRGGRCIFLGISQKEGLNVLETGRELDPVLVAFKKQLPSNMRLEVIYNQPQTVRSRINGFMSNLLQGIVLVGLVIFFSLGFRSSVVVVIAIPLSLTIGLGFVDLSGFGLQQISIGGLVVVLGLLVDNSIVMVENINRYLQMGHSRREASIHAASEIGWPVVTATLTTVLAFVPIAAMPGKAGEFIKSLPVTISLTLSVSLLIALAFTPMITSKFLQPKEKEAHKSRGISAILNWVIEHSFRKILLTALHRPGWTMLLATLFLMGSLAMFPLVGISFFPKAEQANLMIQATLPEGSSLDRTDQVTRHIESVLDTMPEVRYYATNVGHGNPRIYYNVFPKRFDKCYAEVYVQLYHYDSEEFADLIERLRRTFESYPGAGIRVKEFEQGPPFDAPVQIYLSGEDLEVLKGISADVEQMIREQPGAINIDNRFVKTNTELLLNINKEKANMLGVPVIEIDRTIRTAVAGMAVSSFRDPSGKDYPVVLKMDRGDRFGEEVLERIYVSSLSGRQHPLKQFVELELQQAPSSISRYDMERTAEILADVERGYTLDEIMDPVLEQLEKYEMPTAYSYTIGGELEGRSDAFGGVTNAVIIALVSILSVLVLQFRSFRQPLIVFLAIPFAVTGMIWALWITGNTFSFTAFIGLTSLVGIVVNNSIILVDYINKLRERGEPLHKALQLAAETRFTPILLTALTTIGGLLPLTLRGGTLWAPMGWTIIGGLFVSTLLTLVIVPVIYKLLEQKSRDADMA
ncbi:MAG: efflux RND transporter permease subunit [Bacteroidales bacterium]|nr:efflux RND transporter permease subunit [Bacteroidales bacterium]